MNRIAVVAAALGSLAAAGPAHAVPTGNDTTCAMHADVRIDHAAGTYALDGIGTCEPVLFDDMVRTERANVSSTGTFAGDPCGSATWAGVVGMTFRWRDGFSDLPVTGSSTAGVLPLEGVRGIRRVRATLALVPRDGSCADAPPDDAFLGIGQITVDYYSLLWSLP